MLGWASPIISILESTQTSLPSGPVSKDEISWIVFSIGFGGLFGCIFFGWTVDRFGRKLSMYMSFSSQIISWLLIIFAQDANYLIVARAIGGLSSAGTYLVTPLYISEIAHSSVRGTLGAVLTFACTLGMVFALAAGAYLGYLAIAYLSLVPPILLMVGLYRVPDTPNYYLTKKEYLKAEESYKFFHGVDKSVTDLEISHNHSINQKSNKIDEDTNLTVNDFCSRAAIRAIIITLVGILMTQLSGLFVLINYASKFFLAAGSSLSPDDSSIIVGVLHFFGATLSTILVDKVGRAKLVVVSASLTGVCFMIIGFYVNYEMYLLENGLSLKWIPVACLSAAVFIAGLGIIPLPYIIASEIFPQKTRGIVMSVFLTLCWVISFLLLKYYITMVEVFGTQGVMWFFGGLCLFQSVFTILYVPETKGKSVEENIATLSKPLF